MTVATLSADQYWVGNRTRRGSRTQCGPSRTTARDRRRHVEPVEPGVLRWVGQLRASGVKTAVLSNMHDDMVQKIRQDPTWAQNFDCLTLSSEIRLGQT